MPPLTLFNADNPSESHKSSMVNVKLTVLCYIFQILVLCMDYDKDADCAAAKADGSCDRQDKMGTIWRFRCFKTCGACYMK